ncbi:MAG: hypothetical protein OXH00_25975 [Candidatus Poribacteria bacterium]|nr:hypothetical protein [Candidatus Poribacteria bacterium]
MLNTRELKDRVNNEGERIKVVEEAADAGMPVSAYLDSEYDPEKDGELGPDDERLSAAEVITDELDMHTECNPAAGIWPARCEDVIGDPKREFWLKEMCLNAYRSVSYAPQIAAAARKQERRARWERAGTFNSVYDTEPGSTLTPYYDAMAHWDQDVEVDIRLEELTSRYAETSKSDYRATILKYDEAAFREERRTPASDPPMATFETSERPIRPKKRMLAIPFTYEHLREVEFIDKAMEHVEEIAVQRIMAKVDEGLEVMLTGAPNDDGKNSLGGTIIPLTDLDKDATTMTPKAWLTLQKKFKRSYMMTSGIGYDDDITDIQLAKISGTNVMMSALIERDNAVLSGFGGAFRVMNQLSQGIGIGWHDALKDRLQWFQSNGTTKRGGKYNAYIAYDLRKAIEFVTQMNTDIIETTRDMLKQVEYIVCSEIWGWISYQPKKACYIIQMGGLPNNHASTDILKVVDPS